MTSPTLSGAPAIDGSVEEAEWGVADTFTFNSPRAGTSTIRMGYLAETGQLALGLVLADDTAKESGSKKDHVDVLVTPRSPLDHTSPTDMKFTIFRDGSWEYRTGHANTSIGFSTGATRIGSTPASTDANIWTLAVERSAASWEIEMLVEIGSFQANEAIATAIKQSDYDSSDDLATSARPSGFSEIKPSSWERTVLTGRPTVLQLSVSPPNMEAAVGGDILVKLPADAAGGRLTVQVKEPGAGGFIPIGTKQAASPGHNRFHFAPLEPGNWQVQAVWNGDGKYGALTTNPTTISVAPPSPDGVTIMETGSLRTAFQSQDDGSKGEWRYINQVVRAADADGDTLPLVRLDAANSCRKAPWVGLANMGEGPLVLHFDPPVQRAAVALTSPQDAFSANVQAYTSTGALKTEINRDGSCGKPVYTSLGDTKDDVERIEIEYSGKDTREVVDVLFPHPLQSTAPQTVVRADPWPLHAGGTSILHVAAGSPFQLTRSEVTVKNGATTVASETCDASPARAWIDCSLPVDVPASAKKLTVMVQTTDRGGAVKTSSHTLTVEEDKVPPLAELLPRPLVAAKGATVAVTARASDGSGIDGIEMWAHDQDDNMLNEATCAPESLKLTFECNMGVVPPDDGFAFVTATFTDGAGNVKVVGPKPLPVRGTDTDGDGLPDDLERYIGTSPNNADTDGDGLPDGWEVVGVDRNGDGIAELDLAALGADPQVRDLFIEVDWTERDGTSYQPHFGALQLVRNTLSAQGVRLHVDMNQKGNAFDPARYDHGHAAHRELIDHERAGIFMHLLAGEVGGPGSSDGWAIYLPTGPTETQSPSIVGAQLLREIGTLLELGPGGAGTNDDGQPVAYTENYKPNHLSVMNNAYAWGIYVDTVDGMVRVPSLAGVTMGEIDETTLDEPSGLDIDLQDLHKSLRAGPTYVLEEQSVTGLFVRYTCPGEGLVRWASPLGAIDWNCDGTTDDTGVTVDVNKGGQNAGETTLTSFTDWDQLKFRGPVCPQFALTLEEVDDRPASEALHGGSFAPLGLASCPLHPPTILEPNVYTRSVLFAEAPPGPFEDPDGKDNDLDGETDEGFADDDGDGWVNLIDGCPTKIDVIQRDENRNARGDACEALPGAVEGLSATFDLAVGEVFLDWDQVEDAWGYNVYRVDPGNVTRLGNGYPTTLEAAYSDLGGSGESKYIVRAVNTLADQGPAATITPTVDTSQADEGAGGDQPEGVPGPGVWVATLVVALAALAHRRRR